MIIKNLEEVPLEPVPDPEAENVGVRWVIAQKDGAPNFFMRIFELQPGGCTPLHRHPWEHEMLVYEGEGAIVRDGNDVLISKGSVIFVPPEEFHQLKNSSGSTLKVICLIPAPPGH